MKSKPVLLFVVMIAATAPGAISARRPQASASVPVHGYEVVRSYPHDPSAYTQGLLWHKGFLYESAGKYQRSSLRKIQLETGKVIQQVAVAPEFFAEGLALLNGKLFQLTWREHTAFAYDLESFKRTGELSYPWEGWGLTTDGKSLIASDGSNQIRFVDPATFAVQRTIRVFADNDPSHPLREINELEYVNGEIYANVWQSDFIIRIAPATGKLLGVINLTGILPGKSPDETDSVLNGIAYDSDHQRLFITGKLWPRLFEIKIR
jgi:glutaminyl-peptide cyclotransferase